MTIINYKIKLINNEVINIPLNNVSDDINSFFVFGLHKSGSTLLNSIFNEICIKANIEQIAIEEILFSKGITPKQVDIKSLEFNDGICYRGFRYFWIKDAIKNKGQKSILLIRDPRDALISYFYSDKYSHPIPKTGDIATNMQNLRYQMAKYEKPDYDLKWLLNRANFLKNNISDYDKYLNRSNSRIYRYEDIIFYKFEWIKDMIEYLNINLSDSIIKEISERNDIIPDSENPKNHIRSVIPGNYKKHFNNDTINELNIIFKDILSKFGYNTVHHLT